MSIPAYRLVHSSHCNLDVSAETQVAFLRKCVGDLVAAPNCGHDEKNTLINRFIAAERRLGNFALDGLYLPHLKAESSDNCGFDRVGWFVWRRGLDHGSDLLCCCVYGSPEFVNGVCEICLLLLELPSFSERAKAFFRISEFRNFLRTQIQEMKQHITLEEIVRIQNSCAGADWIEVSVDIWNRLGLHARASAKFVNLASTFESDIKVASKRAWHNGKSVMGVMMAGAEGGAWGNSVKIAARGPDASEALASLAELVHNGFGEDGGSALTSIAAKAILKPGQALFVRGSVHPLTWEKGCEMKKAEQGDLWVWDSEDFERAGIKFEFKLLLDDIVWEDLGSELTSNHLGESFKRTVVTPRFGVTVQPPPCRHD